MNIHLFSSFVYLFWLKFQREEASVLVLSTQVSHTNNHALIRSSAGNLHTNQTLILRPSDVET